MESHQSNFYKVWDVTSCKKNCGDCVFLWWAALQRLIWLFCTLVCTKDLFYQYRKFLNSWLTTTWYLITQDAAANFVGFYNKLLFRSVMRDKSPTPSYSFWRKQNYKLHLLKINRFFSFNLVFYKKCFCFMFRTRNCFYKVRTVKLAVLQCCLY